MSNNQGQQVIPMDGAIKEFEKHLKSHPRTILSARFGDGKSFFLAATEKRLKNRFVFLKIYPVNYQVAENQDIFEYIKRDMLFQLYSKGLVPESYEIPDDIASYFFLQNNWEQFAEEFLNTLSYFDASNTIKATLGAAKFLKAMKKKYDEFKKNGGDLGVKLDNFIASFDKKGLYEADPITSILCDIIKSWKQEHKRRKICLVFEDMDRIDPAHIFRILNVISAHLDYGYKYGVSPRSNSLAGNKFGVDNIIVCLDHDNLKHIFHHFYGQKSCFEGYINKFSDKGIFHYSLQEQVQQFYMNELSRVTGMDNQAIQVIMEQVDLTSFTLRQLYHATDGVGQQVSLPTWNRNIVPHRGLYIMAAILRRLGQTSEDICSILGATFQKQPVAIGAYAATSMLLRRNAKQMNFDFSFGEKDEGFLVRYEVRDIHHDGLAFIDRQLNGSWNPKESYSKPEEEIEYILRFVNK